MTKQDHWHARDAAQLCVNRWTGMPVLCIGSAERNGNEPTRLREWSGCVIQVKAKSFSQNIDYRYIYIVYKINFFLSACLQIIDNTLIKN